MKMRLDGRWEDSIFNVQGLYALKESIAVRMWKVEGYVCRVVA